MSFIIVFLIVIALLFAMMFFTKRRLGVVGLGLAAGAILSSLWVGDLTPIIASTGVQLVKPPLESVVSAGLILLPAVLLLMGGPTYKTMPQRIIGAVVFSALAIALLLEPLGSALVIDETGKPVYDFFIQNRTGIVTLGLILAILDLLVTKTPKHPKDHKGH
ncbi:MAG TPA: hypothetical protein VFZ62_00435 [Candidatus Saccharimonadales bacterium]